MTFDRFPYDEGSAAVAVCAWCGGEIYVGDDVKRIDDGFGYVHDGTCAVLYADERVYDGTGRINERGQIYE